MKIERLKMNSRIWSLTVAMVFAPSIFAASVLALQASGARVVTDHTWYLAGEAMTVSIAADNAMIAYVELCDTQGLVAGTMVSLKGGEGTGIIELPSNLHSGYYALSVYTRDNAHVCRQLVAIVNPLRKRVDDDIEWIRITHPDSLSYDSKGDEVEWTEGEKEVDVCETEGHIVKARVKKVTENHFWGSDIIPSMSIVGKQIHYFEGKMVDDSTAVFYTYGIHGRQPLVLSAISSTGVSLPIEVISPFATLLPKQLPHLVFHYNRHEVETRSLDMQRHQMAIAHADDRPSDYDDTAFGTKPDLTYNLDEYRQFLTVREVLLEYVNCVSNRKINGVPQLVVRKEQGSYVSSWPAMVLIDGMPVIDIERLLNYDARRIHYINIYAEKYTFGNGVYNGIVSFISRSGRLTNYPTEPNVQSLVYGLPE